MPNLPSPVANALLSVGGGGLAILTHGAGHLLAAQMVHLRFRRLCLTRTGFCLVSDTQGFRSYESEAVVASGGPLANLFGSALAVLSELIFPALHGFLALFVPTSLYLCLLNLLPIPGFDGGRLLFCLLCARKRRLPSLSPDRAERVLRVAGDALLLLLWGVAVYLMLRCGSALSLFLFCAQLFRAVHLDRAGERLPTLPMESHADSGESARIRKNTGDF